MSIFGKWGNLITVAQDTPVMKESRRGSYTRVGGGIMWEIKRFKRMIFQESEEESVLRKSK